MTDTGWWQLGVVMLEPPETACEAFYVDARFHFSRVVPRNGLAEFNFPADCHAGVSVAVPYCALSGCSPSSPALGVVRVFTLKVLIGVLWRFTWCEFASP